MSWLVLVKSKFKGEYLPNSIKVIEIGDIIPFEVSL
jgi:hypothetical protein